MQESLATVNYESILKHYWPSLLSFLIHYRLNTMLMKKIIERSFMWYWMIIYSNFSSVGKKIIVGELLM